MILIEYKDSGYQDNLELADFKIANFFSHPLPDWMTIYISFA